jgi:hypothetical protein
MIVFEFITQNKEIFRIIYSFLITLTCVIIVTKTNKLFALSHHQGIRYFRNAFFFYGIAFVLRYLLPKPFSFFDLGIIFEFFMVMAGFFILYSLIWKKIEGNEKSRSSLMNLKIFIFYIFAFIISILDFLWNSYNFIFASQIFVFTIASIISYNNSKNKKNASFLKLYFMVMMLSLFAWTLNFIFASFLNWKLQWLAHVYILNIIVFLVFLYGVIKTTKKKHD